MHISDGIISGPLCIAGYAAASLITGLTLKKTDPEEIPKIAVMTAAFFIGSLIHIRIGPTSIHLVLSGLMGIILGIAAFPAILVGLFFQTLLLGHGGLTTLGINSICMGIPALIAGVLFKTVKRCSNSILRQCIVFLCGALPVILGIGLVATFLTLTEMSYLPFVKVVLGAHVVLALIEGTMCVLIIKFLETVKPGVLA